MQYHLLSTVAAMHPYLHLTGSVTHTYTPERRETHPQREIQKNISFDHTTFSNTFIHKNITKQNKKSELLGLRIPCILFSSLRCTFFSIGGVGASSTGRRPPSGTLFFLLLLLFFYLLISCRDRALLLFGPCCN